MKYAKGSFVQVPNIAHIASKEAYVQTVYLWICVHADEGGLCFPSRSTLATKAGCSVKSVDRAIEILCETGLLKKTTRKNEEKNLTNLYQIMLVEGLGSVSQSLGGVSETLGVATEGRTELYPIRTIVTEVVEDDEISDSPRTHKVVPSPYSPGRTSSYWSSGPRHLQILDWYFREAELWERATTVFRLKALMARHSKAAQRISRAGWKPNELEEAKDRIDKNGKLNGEWTLDTIEKYLTK